MSSDGSDIELQSALPKKNTKKMPKSPSDEILSSNKSVPKKTATKTMINQALLDLKTRKGVSLYAIKKYITEKYSVDVEKINYHIKKYLKSAVEEGTIVQMKGIGASGSFKLVVEKEKKKKKVKKIDPEKVSKNEKAKNPDKPKKKMEKSKPKKEEEEVNETETNKKPKVKEGKTEKKDKIVKKKKVDTEKKPKTMKGGEEKGKKVKLVIAKGMQTPAKKSAMMKRKSIGSIIKPPKMRPKAKA